MLDTKKLLKELKQDLAQIDPVCWIEANMTLNGESFSLKNREYLYDIYRYIAFEAPTSRGKPVIVLKSRKVEMSTTMTNLALYFMTSGMFKSITGLHTFPLLEQARRYSSSYFDPLVRTSGLYDTKRNKAGMFSVSHKQFTDENQMFIEGASNEANRLRNMTLDFIFFDEVQDILRQARQNAAEAMANSRFGPSGTGIEVDFGTPKTSHSEFQRLWETSDQRIYHLKCKKCGCFFPITLENFKHGFMIECDSCKTLQDKREAIKEGKWVTTKPDMPRVGFFLNQLLVPSYTRESIERKRQDMIPRTFNNEVLGNFYDDDSEEITYEEIYNATVEHHGKRSKNITFKDKILPTERLCFLGIDWGGKISDDPDMPGKSWTIMTVISREPLDGLLKLEYTEQIKKQMFIQELVNHIKGIWRRFSVTESVVDLGYGQIQTQELQKVFFDKVKGCWFSGNTKSTLKYDPTLFMVTAHKDNIIDEVIESIRNFKWIFPFGDPAKVEWAIKQASSMECKTRIIAGAPRKTWQKGTGPNDFLTSLVYAYIALRFKESGGFRNLNNQNYGKNGSSNYSMPLSTVAYINR